MVGWLARGTLCAFVLLCVLTACAAGAPAGCNGGEMTAYADVVEEQLRQFDQQSRLVAASPRVGLAEPLQRLLDIQTATRGLDVPECLSDYHNRVVVAMNAEQSVFQAFAARQVSDQEIARVLAQVQQNRASLTGYLADIRSGQVPPTPTPAPPTPAP